MDVRHVEPTIRENTLRRSRRRRSDGQQANDFAEQFGRHTTGSSAEANEAPDDTAPAPPSQEAGLGDRIDVTA